MPPRKDDDKPAESLAERAGEALQAVVEAVTPEDEPQHRRPRTCPHCQHQLAPHVDGERFHCSTCGCCFTADRQPRPGHPLCSAALGA